jgi:type IV secretion system protein VirB10
MSADGTVRPDADNVITPLEGEPGIPSVTQSRPTAVSKKGILALVLLVASLIVASAVSINRLVGSTRKDADAESKRVADRPAAATTDPRRLDMALAASVPAAVPERHEYRIPAIERDPEDGPAEPIGVRRTGQAPPGAAAKPMAPEDAPVMLLSTRPPTGSSRSGADSRHGDGNASAAEPDLKDPLNQTRRSLEAYQGQLQGLLDKLTADADSATDRRPLDGPVPLGTPGLASALPNSTSSAGALFGGQLQGSATPRVSAATLGNRSLTLPKGTAFTCALKTKLISATSGLVGCLVQRNVYSDDGRVVLIERGSHLDGEYRITSVRPGTVRIPVLWTRLRTPNGVTVDIDSPATGPLGESGVEGYVDNRWGERIGAAMLLSLIDDSVKLVIQNQTAEGNAGTVIFPSTTSNTSKLAEKVLDSTINIPPLVYRNQGGVVGIYVARDVDFSSVYTLKPTPEEMPR